MKVLVRNPITPALLLCFSAFAAPAGAQCVDQFQLDGTQQEQVIHSTRSLGQTLRIAKSGPLDGIEVSILELGLGAPNDLTLEVLDVSGGDLGAAPVLGSLSFSETDLGPDPLLLQENAFVATYFDLRPLGLVVATGDALGVRFSTTRVLPSRYNLRIVLADTYSEGDFFVDDSPVADAEAAFKVFVATPGVAVAVLGTGVNPPVFQPGPVSPAIGTNWMPLIVGALSPTDVSRFILLGTPGTALSVPPYELLLTPFSPAIVLPAPSSLTPIPIPANCNLVGVTLAAQAGSIAPGEPNGYALANAIYFTIGTE